MYGVVRKFLFFSSRLIPNPIMYADSDIENIRNL